MKIRMILQKCNFPIVYEGFRQADDSRRSVRGTVGKNDHKFFKHSTWPSLGRFFYQVCVVSQFLLEQIYLVDITLFSIKTLQDLLKTYCFIIVGSWLTITYCFDKMQVQPNISTHQKENMRYFMLQTRYFIFQVMKIREGQFFSFCNFFFKISLSKFLFQKFSFKNFFSNFLLQNFQFQNFLSKVFFQNIPFSKFQFQNLSFKVCA